MKTCSKCKIEKELSDFYKKKASKDGFRSECKECNNIASKKYKINYYHRNKDKISKEKNKDYIKKYRELNKNHIRIINKRYRELNKDKLNILRKEYRYNKFLNDAIYKLQHSIRSLISQSFVKYSKNSKTQQILGCTFEEFKLYIESQFLDGMSWDNHGEWHLDHKIPISWADTEEKVYELNHYLNFQPLWAFDNLSKGNKWSD